MTISQILKTYPPKLKTTSSSPTLDVELLLSKTLNKDKEFLYTYPNTQLTNHQITKLTKLFNRRLKGEPIAYILGYKYFYGLKFKVNKNVLIPRPESEILVDEVIRFHKALSPKPKALSKIADIGVGSGAIIIALAKNIKNAKFYGTDISKKALSIAQQNAKIHNVFCQPEVSRRLDKKPCITFFQGNLLKALSSKLKALSSKLIITANLPYLDSKMENLLNSTETKGLQFEPKIAWDGGQDGLKYYQEFFQQIKDYNLKPKAIFLEIGHNQGNDIKKIIKKSLPNYKIKIIKDLCGFDRLLIIKK